MTPEKRRRWPYPIYKQWYDDITHIPWPTRVKRQYRTTIDRENAATSIAQHVILEAEEMFPPSRSWKNSRDSN